MGMFPFNGVVLPAEHIDKITYTLQGFANEFLTPREAIGWLCSNMMLYWTMSELEKVEFVYFWIWAAWYTLIPDSDDNIRSIIDALKKIRDAFGPSESAGTSATAQLQDRFGPMGAVLF